MSFRSLRPFIAWTARRLLTLALTVVAAVYLTILIANLGGEVDKFIAARIDEQLMGQVMGGWLREEPLEERERIFAETAATMRRAAGLEEPFLLRTATWLKDGLTLNWGDVPASLARQGARGTIPVQELILSKLAFTLLIFGTANLLLFFVTVALGLMLSRWYGSRFDRLFALLSPLSAAPAWIYGVLITFVLLRLFTFSTSSTLTAWPTELSWPWVRVLARNLFPVTLAIFLSGLFQGVYVWRAFFFVYANEDYVALARAKGLHPGVVERRYILRPALPGLITSFGLLMVVLWQEVIALEVYFRVGGIGSLLLTALTRYNIPTVVAVVTTFAWILAITLFVMDLIYGLVDPRIRLGAGAGEQAGSVARSEGRRRFWQRRTGPKSPAPLTPRPPWWHPLNPASWALPSLREPLVRTWRELRHYPSALFGLAIIVFLTGVSLYTLIAVPFDQSVARWRGDPQYTVQMRVPRNALPVWANWFRRDKLPVTRTWSSADSEFTLTATPVSETTSEQQIRIPFDYTSRHFPQELIVDFTATFRDKAPHIDMTWHTPDGREIRLDSISITRSQSHFFTHDKRLERRLRGISPEQGLFMQPESDPPAVLPGRYELEISALLFEPDATLDARFSLLGAVYGLAGSDFQRRDLIVPLLWGTPVALAFGLIAALTTSFLAMFMAAIAAWFGGWVDRLVQALTEVNMILPAFPISLMVFILYSKSIWMILAVVVALNIFGVSLKTYRAVFLQVRQLPYVEAAQAYGAGNWRIIGRYLVPRILGILVPRLVIMVPTYVFLEVTLAFLGVADPTFPTWGNLIAGALQLSLNTGAWHVVLLSLGVVMLTGFAFSLLGLSLERILEPRMREE